MNEKPNDGTAWKECPHCHASCLDVKRRRLNTAYPNDESNHLESCGSCFQDAIEYYSDLWGEYHNAVGG